MRAPSSVRKATRSRPKYRSGRTAPRGRSALDATRNHPSGNGVSRRSGRAITDAAAGTPYVGYSNTAASSCTAWGTADLQARAVADLQAWDALLKGAAETDGGTLVGAMIGARGCVSYDDAADVYRVSIAWQGLIATTDPLTVDAALTCGKDLYGSEAQRRIVSTTLRIADLK